MDPFDLLRRAASAASDDTTETIEMADEKENAAENAAEGMVTELIVTKARSLFKTKTFWTGIAGLATVAGTVAAGEMSIAQAVQTGITCLIGIFLRSGMLKG